jgi:hypothetical protein
MTFEELIGLAVVLTFIGIVAFAVASSRLPRGLKNLIYAALALRVVGSWLRYEVLFGFYRGSGDARGYYRRGLEYAERFWQFDFSPFYDPQLWFRGSWTGTSFMSFPSGIILTLTGPSIQGGFLAFSLLAFLGLVGFAVAFHRTTPGVPVTRYARWIWLFPSMWYWPSSLGKEVIILMGLGVAVAGFVGQKGRINWLLLGLGTFFVFAIRPQVAAVVILSFVLAYWLSLGSRWTMQKAMQGLLIVGVGLGGIYVSMDYIGVEGFDVEGVQSYMEETSDSAAEGGSRVENVPVAVHGIPMALVNILVRPFIWEAHNLMALLSAVEILGFWGIVWYRRRNFINALRKWRSHPMLRVAVPFILVYSITLGMLVANLGIIARQRIFLFPFLFLLLEAMPAMERRRRRVPHSATAWQGVQQGSHHPVGPVIR